MTKQEATRVRIVVDHDRCMGHAQCVIVAPDLFKLDALGVVEVLSEFPEDSQRDGLDLAVEHCPEEIIRIERVSAE